jgi:hypothetical protein
MEAHANLTAIDPTNVPKQNFPGVNVKQTPQHLNINPATIRWMDVSSAHIHKALVVHSMKQSDKEESICISSVWS